MYLIDKETNSISRIQEKSFSELGFSERKNLQEWIAKNPSCLGEDLLIIQKEFNGFNDTSERLDLLAIDKFGDLVVIENKLDSSGKDVTWQVIKYASYCASLNKEQICSIYQAYLNKHNIENSAEEKISEFFENKEFEEITLNQGSKQRIIMVAGNFRKEVTSAVLWLRNFNLRIQCIKVTPFAQGENLMLDIEQILPLKDTEDFTISMATKAQEEIAVQEGLKARHYLRLEFWKYFLHEVNNKNSLFSNISPSKDNWIGIGIGMSGVNINLTVTQKYAGVEIFFNRGDKAENEALFDFMYNLRLDIETKFGGKLDWMNLPDKVTCRIYTKLEDVDVFNKSDWQKMTSFFS
ncbi:MAG: DUF4268 domain-containing protein [Bacteroidales bacterium]|nr:DUF4268 domain-containing protein [Bacteroidales bacterium]